MTGEAGQGPNGGRERRSARLQFGIGSLMLLTAVVAGVLASIRPLQAPVEVKVALGCYALLIAGYGAMRGFYLLRRAMRARRLALEHRAELREWLEQRRGGTANGFPVNPALRNAGDQAYNSQDGGAA